MRFVLLSSNFHWILLNCQLWAKHQFWWLLCILWQLLWAVCYLKLTGVINLPSLSHHISQPPLTRRGRRAAAKQIWIRDRLLLMQPVCDGCAVSLLNQWSWLQGRDPPQPFNSNETRRHCISVRILRLYTKQRQFKRTGLWMHLTNYIQIYTKINRYLDFDIGRN